MKRVLKITTSNKKNNISLIEDLLKKDFVEKRIKDYNLDVIIYKNNKYHTTTIYLIGYDGDIKKTYNVLNEDILDDIFKTIDKMPMRKYEVSIKKGGDMIKQMRNHKSYEHEHNNVAKYKKKYDYYKIKYMNLKYIADTL